MKYHIQIIITLLFLLTLLPVYAQDITSYKRGEVIDLQVPCYVDGVACNSTFACNISVSYPDSSLFINNQLMDYNPSFFNYTLPSSDVTGVYSANAYCYAGSIGSYDVFQFSIGAAETDNLTIFLAFVAITLFLIFLGLIIPAGLLRISAFLMAFIELSFMFFVLFVSQSGGAVQDYLQWNFYILLIVGFSVFMLQLILIAFDMVNHDHEDKMQAGKKWVK